LIEVADSRCAFLIDPVPAFGANALSVGVEGHGNFVTCEALLSWEVSIRPCVTTDVDLLVFRICYRILNVSSPDSNLFRKDLHLQVLKDAETRLVEPQEEVLVRHIELAIVGILEVHLLLEVVGPESRFVAPVTVVHFLAPWVSNLSQSMNDLTRAVFKVDNFQKGVSVTGDEAIEAFASLAASGCHGIVVLMEPVMNWSHFGETLSLMVNESDGLAC